MRIAILIPAAGNSSRLGQPKQLVDFNGQPLLLRQIKLCLALSPNLSATLSKNLYCVLGANAQAITQQVNHPNCHFITTDQWQKGLAYSIAFGVNQLPDTTDAVMIVLGDQWALQQHDLNRLIAQWAKQPDKIHAALYQQQTGVPAIFPAKYFTQLAQPLKPIPGSAKQRGGAKHLLNKYQDEVVSWAIQNASHDLDTPEQYQQILLRMENNNDHFNY
jgi:molybdenum cofactor cytidylyltransferase